MMITSFLALCLTVPATPQAPPGYYATVDDSNAINLRTTLHDVIDDHTRRPYTSSSLDTWDILNLAQEDPSDSNRIIDVYGNQSFNKGDSNYNREHTWPKSYGFPDDGSDNYPYTDCHLLRLCDGGYNSARSNRPFRQCSSSCSEYTTSGGGSGSYPGNSNWGSGSFTNGTWEVWTGRQGDVARGLFYADVRYNGDNHTFTGVNEPDLILTNSTSLIGQSNTGSNEDTAYMGMLSVLLQWHLADPVDTFEVNRNNVVHQLQGNRNPFVDHPEWIDCLFSANCGGTGGTGGSVDYCAPGVPNSTGLSGIILPAGSFAVADQNFSLIAGQLPSNQFGYFLVSATQAATPGPGGSQGVLCLGGSLGRFNNQVQNSGLLGTFQIQVDINSLPLNPAVSVLPGETWNFQTWFRDLNPVPTSNFTHAIAVTFE